MVKASNRRRKQIVMNAIPVPATQETDLAKIYLRVVKIWETGWVETIQPAYSRTLAQTANDVAFDSVEDIDIAIAAVNGYAVQAVIESRIPLENWANTATLRHMQKFVTQLKYKTNVDLSTMVGTTDTQETIQDVIARNTSLIRNVSDQTRGRIGDIVFRNIQQRTPIRDVAKEIAEATGLARDRSLRIASDQSVKLSATLDKERQLQVGMDSFEWMHSGKLHFRPEHKARNGKIFKWDSVVGRTDPPGFQPFCGCKSRGVLDLGDDE